MFCDKCGQSLSSGSRFCSQCGAEVPQAATDVIPYASAAGAPISGEQPVLIVRPTFLGWKAMLSAGPVGCLLGPMLVFGCLPFTCFSCIVSSSTNNVGAAVFPGALAGLLWLAILALGPVAAYLLMKKAYARTEYRFYTDRLDYYSGFLFISQSSVRYHNIIEVQMIQGVFQKPNNLGTLVLSTAAAGGQESLRGVVRIVDVHDPQGLYDQIQHFLRGAQVK